MKPKLRERYRAIRSFTELLTKPLSPEDCCIQTMPDVSPTRWHLAHTTWFFETFLLNNLRDYKPFDSDYGYLFNSYYNSIGEQFPRSKRGSLSRPGLEEIQAYRKYVDEQMLAWFEEEISMEKQFSDIVEIGLHHEQQHQELILTDIKHVLSCNPLFPAYACGEFAQTGVNSPLKDWIQFDEGVYWIGQEGDGFAFDNESPRHRVFLETFQMNRRLVTCGEYLRFIEDGGYSRPDLWLSLGWQTLSSNGWQAPLYWTKIEDSWHQFTLAGLRPIEAAQPVCHISYFEADAFARWAGLRLPTEAEWEVAANTVEMAGRFADVLLDENAPIHPSNPSNQILGDQQLQQMFGDVWEWTSSAYSPYPGYQAPEGALGEYNGKFMCNQFVLRGGSCATPSSHMRPTYRNFFPPETRWQFTGIRLCK